jgi:hypothetical protein
MLRWSGLLLIAVCATAEALAPVDIDTAATVYQEAAIRQQVRASLGNMPVQIRRLFESDAAAKLSDDQLGAVTAAAKRGFRIDVFEAPALSVFAANLDAPTVKKTEAFLGSDLGKRMVAADVAIATMDQADLDKVMNGTLSAPSTPQREAILDKLERASHTTEAAVQIFLTMGSAVAVGTAVGAGSDPANVVQRSRQAGDESRASLEQNLRQPLRRYLTYGYRDLSDEDLRHVLQFLESKPGQRYISAYVASMDAGFKAMGRRCGEQLGESLRELAQAQLATTRRDDAPGAAARGEPSPGEAVPPAIANPNLPPPKR